MSNQALFLFLFAKNKLVNTLFLRQIDAMKIEQIYTGCIAQAAYYLESKGEAAIFDPLREVEPWYVWNCYWIELYVVSKIYLPK